MRKIITMVMALFFLSACTTAVAGTSTSTKPTATKQPAWTSVPTWTITPTSTTLPTLAPMLIPSPGPAPDVEFVNVNIQGEHANAGWFLGEIRNNSNDVVIFTGSEYNYHFLIDYSRWDNATVGGFLQENVLRDFYMSASTGSYAENAPCYLFPGEIGVMSFDVYNHCLRDDEHCHVVEEYLSEPPKGIGYQLQGYEITYRLWAEFLENKNFSNHPKEISPNLHLRVENVNYEIVNDSEMDNGDVLLVRFDVEYRKPEFLTIRNIPVWVVLYDESGAIVNVLHNRDLAFCTGKDCLKDGRYHIVGAGCEYESCQFESWAAPGETVQWFKPGLKPTRADFQRVDRIRVFIELQSSSICHSTIIW